MQHVETSGPSGPEPHADADAAAPGCSAPEGGGASEVLDWIKLRKTQLNFRRTLLLKRQKLRMRVSEAQEAEVQLQELGVISRELEDLTAQQRDLGFCEEEDVHWPPPPPPCVHFAQVKKVAPIPANELGMESALTECSSCGRIVFTRTTRKIGDANWTVCFLTALLGGVLGCCLIPFCMDGLKDVHHICPKCEAEIHVQEKM